MTPEPTAADWDTREREHEVNDGAVVRPKDNQSEATI